MNIIVRNQAQIPNKYIRFAQWKLRQLDKKFNQLLYTVIYISKEGQYTPTYAATIKLGIPGNDMVIKTKSKNLNILWQNTFESVKTRMRRLKKQRTN
jgi:hypothetical protein